MSESKHTPGPWAVYRAKNGKLLGVGDARAEGVTDPFGGLWRSGAEMEANARLIAAAPELLEAAKMALADQQQPETEVTGAYSYLAKAIAKAEGR